MARAREKTVWQEVARTLFGVASDNRDTLLQAMYAQLDLAQLYTEKGDMDKARVAWECAVDDALILELPVHASAIVQASGLPLSIWEAGNESLV